MCFHLAVSHYSTATPAPGAPRHTVLIVDDDRATVGVMAELLELEGFEVWQAFSAGEGLALLAQRQPELLLLDVRLPDADGREVCAALKANPKLVSTVSTCFSRPDAKNGRVSSESNCPAL